MVAKGYEPYLMSGLVGIVSFTLSLYLVTITASRLNVDALNVFVEATVQLLGFGGVIFAVLYHEQRTMLAKHRRERVRVTEEIIEDTKKQIFVQLSMSSQQALKKLTEHDKALGKGAGIYLYGSKSFFLGFAALGISLILELIHEVLLDAMNKSSVYALSASSLLVSSECALVAIAIVSFIAAWFQSMKLPLEPD